jgi:hypothetical protein
MHSLCLKDQLFSKCSNYIVLLISKFMCCVIGHKIIGFFCIYMCLQCHITDYLLVESPLSECLYINSMICFSHIGP